jgi:hypothetical protein
MVIQFLGKCTLTPSPAFYGMSFYPFSVHPNSIAAYKAFEKINEVGLSLFVGEYHLQRVAMCNHSLVIAKDAH